MKNSLRVLLQWVLVLLNVGLLSGCANVHSSDAWKQVRQESPLQIPPGLDRPAATDALVIPVPGPRKSLPHASGY